LFMHFRDNMLTGGLRHRTNYRAVILSGGEAGVRDLTRAECFAAADENSLGACGVGISLRCYCRCWRIVRSLGGLAPSSG